MTTKDAARIDSAHLRWGRWATEKGIYNEYDLRDRHNRPLPDPGVTDRRWRRLAAGCTAAVADARVNGLDDL